MLPPRALRVHPVDAGSFQGASKAHTCLRVLPRARCPDDTDGMPRGALRVGSETRCGLSQRIPPTTEKQTQCLACALGTSTSGNGSIVCQMCAAGPKTRALLAVGYIAP